jgi:transposase
VFVDAETEMILCIEQAHGSVHDFQLYKDSIGSAVSPDIEIKADSGYQGIASYHANSTIPHKKNKNKLLSKEEKAFNRQLSRERILIEHINRRIKIFKIMSERYRNRRRRHKLRMTLICAICNYEIGHHRN